MDKEKSNKITLDRTALYGRARRIELVEKIAYIVIAIISVILVFVIVRKRSTYNDENVDFNLLRKYLEVRGYNCYLVYQPGGACTFVNEKSKLQFIHQEDGFEYYEQTSGYTLSIVLTEEKGDYITLRTTSEALPGYRNKTYTCTYKKYILDDLESCEDKDGNVLDSNAYKGIVEKGMYDVNNMILNSGYRRESLLKNHEWIKK